MNRSKARRSRRTLGLIASLVFLPRLAAHAAPELGLAEAKTALVDLDSLWTRATNDVALGEGYLNSYLSATPPAGVLPVVPVTAQDARELYRRQAFLSLYVQKHSAFLALVRSGTVPASVRLDEAELRSFARRARAAELELYLIAWIVLGEGETLEQKCAANARTTGHARTLGLSGGTPLPDADFPPAWLPLYARARQLDAGRETRFRAALCSEGAPASRAGTRQALEGMLDAKLDKALGQHFDRTATGLAQVQQGFTDLVKASDVLVPRDQLLALQKRVADAQSVYQLVGSDTYGLGARIAELSELTATLLTTMDAQQSGDTAFAAPQRELASLRDTLSSFLVLAKSLAVIRFPTAADNTALSVCSSLPDHVELASGSLDLPGTVDRCLGAALSIRARLFTTPSTPPERVALLGHLQSLSTAFLNNNRF